MRYDELNYYEEELGRLRKAGQEFAEQHPRIAGQLRLEADQSTDPHVERLLQGFAFIAGRIRRKIDEKFPETAEALLNVLYPHYLAPIPSMAVAQFVPDPEQKPLTSDYTLAKDTTLYATQKINDVQCRFRTCYPLTLWPVKVESAQFDGVNSVVQWPEKAAGVIRLHLRCLGDATFPDLQLERLRFFLHGAGKTAHALYEMLFNNTVAVQVRSRDASNPTVFPLSHDCLQSVGFDKEEGMLPYPRNAFIGYRLLHEYFTFPEKFLFVDICGLKQEADSPCAREFEILIFVDRPPQTGPKISEENFLLGCTPIINLFTKTAEPINVDGTKAEYLVVPEQARRRAFEVYSIDRVMSASQADDRTRYFQPLYSYKHVADDKSEEAFWYARRKFSSLEDDHGTDVALAVVDLALDPARVDVQALTVQTTCTNRDLPLHLSFEEDEPHFEVEDKAALHRIRCVVKPTPPARPPQSGEAQWRLISHLSLNYLSLTDGEDGRKALQEILKLYDFADSLANQHQIERIVSVESRRVVRRLSDVNGGSFGRGLEVTLTLDDEYFPNHDAFLFSAVLEKFLGLYVSLNSFSQLVVKTTQRNKQSKGPLKTWMPRAGEKLLL